jgi:hypothetical protein
MEIFFMKPKRLTLLFVSFSGFNTFVPGFARIAG